ncbi:unnamed protein product [Symbiodinium sp. KB8]|nr:unnamed protein product [Symbiodinium sp. KB8]
MRAGGQLDPDTDQIIRELRAEVRALTLRVQALEARAAILEESDFELVPPATPASSSGPAEVARACPARSVPAAATSSSSRLPPESPEDRNSEAPIAASDIEARVALAKEIGFFLRRSIEGSYRGLSGRNRLRLQSKLYVAVSDSAGQPFAEPRVFNRLGDLRSAVFSRGNPGSATFIGFASQWEARLALEAVPLWELEEVDGEVVTLRDCLLDLREAIDCHRVSLGVLRTPGGDGEQSFALVPITTLEERCLVAVPHAAWNKAIARRRLPRDALSRGVNLEVPAQGEPPTQAHAAFKVKVWVGFLNHELEDSWTAGKTLSLGEEEAETVEDRVSAVERALGAEQKGLERLLDRQNEPAPRQTASARPAVATEGLLASRIESQLRLLSAMAENPTRMPDGRAAPAKTAVRKSGPLSESDEEAPAAAGAALAEEEVQKLPPVERAVVEMSALLQKLAKKEERPRPDLEDLLDRAEGLGGSSSDAAGSQGVSRSKAAAYLKLSRLLKEEPERIVESISRLVEEDFSGHRLGPGAHQQTATMRGWLEHRSHIPGLAGPARWSWAVGGIADCLAAGRTTEAHARSLLLVAAADQAAIDSGSWLLGAEFLLEPYAPLQAFARHTRPEMHEQQSTRILDPRWVSVAMSRVRERESFVEVRRKLGGGGGRPPGGGSAAQDPSEKDDKGDKGGGKGGRKGPRSDKSEQGAK